MPRPSLDELNALFNPMDKDPKKTSFRLTPEKEAEVRKILNSLSDDEITNLLKVSKKTPHHRKALLCNLYDRDVDTVIEEIHAILEADIKIAFQRHHDSLPKLHTPGEPLHTIASASSSASSTTTLAPREESLTNTLDNITAANLIQRQRSQSWDF